MPNLITETTLNFSQNQEIGSGGMATVFLALDLQLNANIAIKRIPIASFNNPNDYYEEAKKLYISEHQNVVHIKYGCRDQQFVYLAMPFYENGSLKGIIDSRFLTSREIIRYSLQFLSGLNSIHVKGLLHFDVKPENILVNQADQALISDFGLAQYVNRYGFAVVFGTTPVLAPPEFFQQQEHNIKFDIYQVGLTLYRLCIGDTIFMNQLNGARQRRGVSNDNILVERILNGQFPDRSFYFPHTPKALRRIIRKSLQLDPNDRYSSVIEIMEDIAKVRPVTDWSFSTDFQAVEEWNEGTKVVRAQLGDNSTWSVEARKNGRRKRNYCTSNLSTAEKNNLAYTALNTSW